MRASRTWFSVTAVVGVLLLLAAGCRAGDEGPGQASEDVCAQDQFGCVTYGPGEPIKIATILTISGDTAELGQDSQRGVQLAVDYLDGKLDGKAGQLEGHPVSLQHQDGGCSAEGGQAAATRVAADPTILAVIGTSCSSEALGVADKILSEKGMLLISPSNTSPQLTAEGSHQPFYLRTAHNDKIQGLVVAEFAYKELGARSAATIHDESPYADALAAVFRNNFEKMGGKITANEAIQSSDTDFKPLLTRIAEGKPDFLYFPNFNPACALIAKQAREIPGLQDTKMAGSDGCLAPAYLETGGSDVNGTYASSPDFSGLQESSDFYANEFLPAYREQFGTDPSAAFHAHAFDGTTILFEAIKRAAIKGEDGSLTIPRTKLKDEIFKTKDHKGLIGTITCTPLGDCATSVTIAVYEAPNWPVEGGDPNAKPVFTATKTLAEAGE